MTAMSETEALCKQQLALYPKLEAQDLVKALYQCAFGCGHLVGAGGLDWLQSEARDCLGAHRDAQPPLTEPLGRRYARVHLPRLAACGLAPSTLYRLFVLSAKAPSDDRAAFHEQLELLEALVDTGALPLDPHKTRAYLAEYRGAGCPAVHHSACFRQAYAPAYRVVKARFAALLPLFAAIDRLCAERPRVLLAIEGGSASGKTSLGTLLASVYDCNVFHMDDYFLQAAQRTPERYAEPGGNVDRERFSAEVLRGVASGDAFSYRPFDCGAMAVGAPIEVAPKRLNIVEGAYSMHPALADAYDLSVFLPIDAQTQARRILARNGTAMLRRFLTEWIPLENRYISQTHAEARCSLRLPPDEQEEDPT